MTTTKGINWEIVSKEAEAQVRQVTEWNGHQLELIQQQQAKITELEIKNKQLENTYYTIYTEVEAQKKIILQLKRSCLSKDITIAELQGYIRGRDTEQRNVKAQSEPTVIVDKALLYRYVAENASYGGVANGVAPWEQDWLDIESSSKNQGKDY